MSQPVDTGFQKREKQRAELNGRLAEIGSIVYFLFLGYLPLARRWKCSLGEIDLIVCRGRNVRFIEVKYRKNHENLICALQPRQLRRLRLAAETWISRQERPHSLDVGFDALLWARWRWPRRLRAIVDASPVAGARNR